MKFIQASEQIDKIRDPHPKFGWWWMPTAWLAVFYLHQTCGCFASLRIDGTKHLNSQKGFYFFLAVNRPICNLITIP
jgi:hypothetical protein